MKKYFTRSIEKVNDINLILLYKSGGDLIGKHYYTKKN